MEIISKQSRKRRRLLLPLCIWLVAGLFMRAMNVYAAEPDNDSREQATEWLEQACDEAGMWGTDGLPNATCDALGVLALEQRSTTSIYLEEWLGNGEEKNTDELAHLAWAYGDGGILGQICQRQNEDGGFGLNETYTSDVYDTMLVLNAAASVNQQNRTNNDSQEDAEVQNAASCEEMIQGAVEYLVGQQKEDGGYGYTPANASDPGLTADIGIALIRNGVMDEEFFSSMDAYCLAAYTMDFSEEQFGTQARLARYLYMREKIVNAEATEEQLQAVPLQNGSIYDDIENTVQYILLEQEIRNYYQLKFQVVSVKTTADSYVLEIGEAKTINLDTRIAYRINQEQEGTLRYRLLQDNEEILIWEQAAEFLPEQTEVEIQTDFSVCGEEDADYRLVLELWMPDGEATDTLWEKEEISFSLHRTVTEELELQGSTSAGAEYSINLYWNELANEDERYFSDRQGVL